MKTKIKSLHIKLLFDMDLNLLLKQKKEREKERKKENIGPRGTPFYNSNKNNLIYISLRFRRKYISAFFFCFCLENRFLTVTKTVSIS